MSKPWQRWAWLTAKVVLAVAILVAVGWQFYRDLSNPELHDLTWRPAWLLLSAALYLLFLATSCWYWHRLLRHFGQHATGPVAARAYFVSQLAKYVPGKAWTVLLRGTLVSGPTVRLSVAIVTTFYEVLTTMAAGALLAAIALFIEPPTVFDLELHPALAGMILLGICGMPLLPGVFNRIVGRMMKKFQSGDEVSLPPINLRILAEGLALTSFGWMLLAVSVWAGLCAVLPEPPALDVTTWLRCLGAIGLAYVGGFLAVFLPAGFGAREGLLRVLLAFAGPSALITTAVLLMRVAWTLGEVVVAAGVYLWRPPSPISNENRGPV